MALFAFVNICQDDKAVFPAIRNEPSPTYSLAASESSNKQGRLWSTSMTNFLGGWWDYNDTGKNPSQLHEVFESFSNADPLHYHCKNLIIKQRRRRNKRSARSMEA